MSNVFFSSTLMWNGSLKQMFRTAKENGFAGMEIWAQHFEAKNFSEDECRRLAAACGMKLVVHAPSWDVNLASMSKTLRRASVEETERAIDFALRIGAGEMTLHPGQASPPAEKEASYGPMSESLCELHGYALSRNLEISLEVMEKIPIMLTYSEDTMKRATGDLFKMFSYTVDAAHCDREEEIFVLLDLLPRVSKVHISNRSGARLHTPLSAGDHDFTRIIPVLYGMGIPVVIEGIDVKPDFPRLRSEVSFISQVMGNTCPDTAKATEVSGRTLCF